MALLTSGPLQDLFLGVSGSEKRLGETLTPLVFNPGSAEYVRLRTEQQAGTIGVSEAYNISFTASTMLAEAVIENLAHATGLPVSLVERAGREIQITSPQLPELSLIAVGPGPERAEEPKSRVIIMPRCVSMALSAGDPLMSWSRQEQTGMPLNFEVLQDVRTGEFFTVRDYTPFIDRTIGVKDSTISTAVAANTAAVTFDGGANNPPDFLTDPNNDVVGGFTGEIDWDGAELPLVMTFTGAADPVLKTTTTGTIAAAQNEIYYGTLTVKDGAEQRTSAPIKVTVNI